MRSEILLPGSLELLKRVMELPELTSFQLAGGTALALQLGHRKSIDFDLFGQSPLDTEALVAAFVSLGSVEETGRSDVTLQLTLNGVKIDIVSYRYRLLQSVVVEEGIRLLSLPDIGAMKLLNVSNRGTRRDFVDVCFLLERYSLLELMQFFQRKFHTASVLHAVRSLCYFEDAERDVSPKMIRSMSWEEVKRRIEGAVKGLDLKSLTGGS